MSDAPDNVSDPPKGEDNPSDGPQNSGNPPASRGGDRGRGRGRRGSRGRGSSNRGGRGGSPQVQNPSSDSNQSNYPRGFGSGRGIIGSRGNSQRSQGRNSNRTASGGGPQSGGNRSGVQSWRSNPSLPNTESVNRPSRDEGRLTQSLEAMSIDQPIATAEGTSESVEATKARIAEDKRKRQAERQEKKEEYEAKLQHWALGERNMPPSPGNINDPPILAESVDTSKLISANFFKLAFSAAQVLKVYRFDLEDDDNVEPINRKVRRQAIEQFLESRPPSPQMHLWATDYFATIISVGDLYSEPFPNENQTVVPPWGGNIFEIKVGIAFQREINLSELSNLVTTGRSSSDDYHHNEDIKALNLITWKLITKDESQVRYVGKRFFPQKQTLCKAIKRSKFKKPVGPRVFIARMGFFTSVRPGNGNLLLNVNVSTSAFYPAESLSDWMWSRFRGNVSDAEKELVGLRVTFILDQDPRPIRTISRLGRNVKDQIVGGIGVNTVNLWNFMRNSHNNVAFDTRARAIGFGDQGHKRWLPADKLVIEPWQPLRSKIHPDFADSMIAAATKSPAEVRKLVMSYAVGPLGIKSNEVVEENQNQSVVTEADSANQLPEFQEPDSPDSFQDFLPYFGFNAAPNFVELKSRELKPPALQFKNKIEYLPSKAEDKWASWDLADKKFYTAAECRDLAIIVIDEEKYKKKIDGSENPMDTEFATIQKWANNFVRQLKKYGLSTRGGPDVGFAAIQEDDDYQTRRAKWQNALDLAYRNFKNVSLLVFILPRPDTRIYSDIKWWADCVAGVPSIGVQRDKIEGMGLRHFGNLCLKANLKLTGTNHNIMGGNIFPGRRERTMVVGADVSHTQSGSDPTCPSLASVVATSSTTSWQYSGSARLQSRNTEHIAELGLMIAERMAAYKTANGFFPDHILFYRDGVSETQYGMVFSEELPQIQQEAQKAVGDQSSRPNITLLVVGKRHHTRFFPHNKYADKNLTAGLVIDHTVVNPQHFNFYLQSHNSPLGTARSAHYVVIENESNYTPHELQEVTNKLCYTGSKASVSLSVCTPARYADLLCERLRCYMRPFLNGEITPNPNKTLRDYLEDKYSWCMEDPDAGLNANMGQQPWHPNLENSMFYL